MRKREFFELSQQGISKGILRSLIYFHDPNIYLRTVFYPVTMLPINMIPALSGLLHKALSNNVRTQYFFEATYGRMGRQRGGLMEIS